MLYIVHDAVVPASWFHNGPMSVAALCGVWHTPQTVFGSDSFPVAVFQVYILWEKSCPEPMMPAWAVTASREPAATVRMREIVALQSGLFEEIEITRNKNNIVPYDRKDAPDAA